MQATLNTGIIPLTTIGEARFYTLNVRCIRDNGRRVTNKVEQLVIAGENAIAPLCLFLPDHEALFYNATKRTVQVLKIGGNTPLAIRCEEEEELELNMATLARIQTLLHAAKNAKVIPTILWAGKESTILPDLRLMPLERQALEPRVYSVGTRVRAKQCVFAIGKDRGLYHLFLTLPDESAPLQLKLPGGRAIFFDQLNRQVIQIQLDKEFKEDETEIPQNPNNLIELNKLDIERMQRMVIAAHIVNVIPILCFGKMHSTVIPNLMEDR